MTKRKRDMSSFTEVARATLRHIRMSPRKARLVVDLIRGEPVSSALAQLKFSPKKGSVLAKKLLESAVANAKESNPSIDIDTLSVTGGFVDEGRTLKRYMPAAHGRAAPIRKRSSHMTVVVGRK